MSLVDAVKGKDAALVKKLISEGVDVNPAVGLYGWTPLRWAANIGHVECARILLNANADVNKVNNDSRTPLHVASNGGHVECVKLLIEYKGHVNAKDTYGRSPLHYAAEYGHVKCLEVLLRAGAKVDECNKDGDSPLAEAICCSKLHCAELLLDAGAKTSNVNSNVDIPDWMSEMITKRRHAMQSLLVLSGVLRRRFKVHCLATAHIGYHIPRDVVNFIALLAWTTRLDSRWNVDKVLATK